MSRGPRHVVLVTDGEQRSALALVRSLGRAGHEVHVAARARGSLAASSRYARRSFVAPDPLREPAAYAETLAAEARRRGADVIIPTTDDAMLALLPEREGRLAGLHLPFGSLESYRAVSDKGLVHAAAPAFGIAVPRQHRLDSRSAPVPDDLPYPVVVKPARSVGEHAGRRVRTSVRYAEDRAALERIIAETDEGAFPLLLQQRVLGPGIGVFLLLWNGELRASFAHRRLREKPPSGGVSVLRESVAADPGLVARSRALLEHFGWQGIAMVEYKVEAATGTPYLMEINARFWGSLQLAVDAGVDFPTLLLAAAVDGRHLAVPAYRPAVRLRWFWGDVDQLLTRLRRGRDELALPPGFPGRFSAVVEFIASARSRDRNETLRLNDPRPFLRETLLWLQRR